MVKQKMVAATILGIATGMKILVSIWKWPAPSSPTGPRWDNTLPPRRWQPADGPPTAPPAGSAGPLRWRGCRRAWWVASRTLRDADADGLGVRDAGCRQDRHFSLKGEPTGHNRSTIARS